MLEAIHEICVDRIVCDVIGGIHFTNIPRGGNTLPKTIKYKISMCSLGEISITYRIFPPYKQACRRRHMEGGKLQL